MNSNILTLQRFKRTSEQLQNWACFSEFNRSESNDKINMFEDENAMKTLYDIQIVAPYQPSICEHIFHHLG